MANRGEQITAMNLVAKNNPYGLAKLLQIQPKVDIEGLDPNGNTPLMLAAQQGSPTCVKLLLEAGANYKQINVFGQNSLTLATRASSVECIKMLLAKWSYANYSESSLMPPLCVAAYYGHLHLVRVFSKMYPGPEHINTVHGLSALTLAMTRGHRNIEDYFMRYHPTVARGVY